MRSNGYKGSRLLVADYCKIGTNNYKPGASLYSDATKHSVDYPLLFVVVTLVLIGLVLIYASTYHLGFRYLKWQFLRALFGLGVLWFGAKIKVSRLGQKRVGWVLIVSTIGLLILTLFLGNETGVVKRQLLGIQPQEFAKYALIIWLAGYFSSLKEQDLKPKFLNSIIKPGAVVGMIVTLTLLQPAVGTSIIITLASFAMFLFAGVRWRYILFTMLFGIAVVIVGLLAMPVLRNTRYKYIPERWDRFVSGDRYHQTQALIALGSGGPVGRGLGEGRQKFYFLPKLHNDFIFCALGEDFGFVGCVVVMFFYALFFLRALRIAEKTTSEFGQLLSSGIGVVVMLYAMVHIAVSLGCLPTTGQPLPFISYGGSALVANLLAAGLVLSVSRYKRSGFEETNFDSRGWNRRPHLSRARARV
ncbi:MAG: FtsW/RodA/SpoVE family cell cycle protein [bacterium]